MVCATTQLTKHKCNSQALIVKRLLFQKTGFNLVATDQGLFRMVFIELVVAWFMVCEGHYTIILITISNSCQFQVITGLLVILYANANLKDY